MTKTVLVDQDGVLADWVGNFNKVLSTLFPDIPVVAPENIKEFKVYKAYAAEHKAACMEVMDSDLFYANLEPIEGARLALEEMEAMGLDVRICTSPFVTNYGCASEKIAWGKEHLGSKWMDKFIITSDKTYVRGDILVDDKTEINGNFLDTSMMSNAADSLSSPTWQQVLFAQPYNVNGKDARGNLLPRMENWSTWKTTILPLLA